MSFSGPSFAPQLGVFLLVMGVVYFLIMAATIAIGILALIAWWRASVAHQSLAQSVKELVDKLPSTASGRETSGSTGPQSGT